MKNRFVARLAAVSAMFSVTSAQAAETADCFTRSEVRSIVGFLVPVALAPAIKTCKAHLAPDAYLVTGGQQVNEALAAKKDAEWATAKGAFLRVFSKGPDKMPDMPDSFLRTMFEEKFGSEILGKISAEDCQDFSNIAAKLSPLSPDAMVDLITEIGIVALRDGKKARGFKVCSGA